MITPKIESLIIKYLTDQISVSELEILETWILKAQNEEIFKSYIKINFAIDYSMKNFDKNNTMNQLLEMIDNEKKVIKMKSFYRIAKYAVAAVLVGVLATVYFFKDKFIENSMEIEPAIVNTIKTGTDKAVLTLENGTNIALEKGKSYETANLNSNGETLVYDPKSEASNREIAYNYLTIPRGGQFFVQLSDGTGVWLNSESKLKYPVSFVEGETREVELVYGEAYFGVSSSSKHKGAGFKVHTLIQEVAVLGTEFNIKAYQDDKNIYTTLVEGKVEISNDLSNRILIPNQQSKINIEGNGITIYEVDTYDETSWRKGVFSFKNKSLHEIMKVISRWYDIDIKFENDELENVKFNGVLSKKQSIENILLTIKTTNDFTYEIKNDKIILK